VKEPVAVCPPASVATTVVPEVPAGTWNWQLNAPVALVVRLPVLQLEIVWESNTSEASGVETENPVPLTVTLAPWGPCAGVTDIDGVVTVNGVVALWPPASVARTVVPEVPEGTEKPQVKAPAAPVVSEPELHEWIATESKTKDWMGVETENPVPLTLTDAPIGPWVGVAVIEGVVTLNVPDVLWPPASVAVTVVPAVPEGTANPQEKAPVAPVVSDPDVHDEIVMVSKTSEASGLETEKPVPATVTAAPTGPWEGDTVIMRAVTRNVGLFVRLDVLRSSPVIPYDPGDTLGMEKVQTKLPVVFVVMTVEADEHGAPPVGGWGAPWNVTLAGPTTLNPVPVTVNVLPTGPCEGTREIDGSVTSNNTELDSVALVVSFPVTLYSPTGSEAGTSKLHEKAPLPSVVMFDPV